MDVDAFLADSVVVADGKLFAQGAGWNMISVQGLPAQHDRIGIGLIIAVPYTETNKEHAFSLHLETEDGDRRPSPPAPDPMDRFVPFPRAAAPDARFEDVHELRQFMVSSRRRTRPRPPTAQRPDRGRGSGAGRAPLPRSAAPRARCVR